MTRAMRRLPVLLAVSFLVAAGCGDDDDDSSEEAAASSSSPAQACLDSWNPQANGATRRRWRASSQRPAGTPEDPRRDMAGVRTHGSLPER